MAEQTPQMTPEQNRVSTEMLGLLMTESDGLGPSIRFDEMMRELRETAGDDPEQLTYMLGSMCFALAHVIHPLRMLPGGDLMAQQMLMMYTRRLHAGGVSQ